jgi:hypothetical protein
MGIGPNHAGHVFLALVRRRVSIVLFGFHSSIAEMSLLDGLPQGACLNGLRPSSFPLEWLEWEWYEEFPDLDANVHFT